MSNKKHSPYLKHLTPEKVFSVVRDILSVFRKYSLSADQVGKILGVVQDLFNESGRIAPVTERDSFKQRLLKAVGWIKRIRSTDHSRRVG